MKWSIAQNVGIVVLMFILASIPAGAASLMIPDGDPPLPQDDRAANAPRSSSATGHNGNSPVAPFVKNDSHFVTDVDTWLDRYLFRKDVPNGRLTFTIAIDRYYSPFITNDTVDGRGFLKSDTYQKLIDNHLLPDKATLTLQVWDVDHNVPFPNCAEVDHVFVNGLQVQNVTNTGPATLSSGNQTWSTWSTPIPTVMLKFPTRQGNNGGRPPAAANEIEIEIDVACNSRWAVEVDWGAIYIPSPIRPVVFAHGWTADEHTFDAFAGFMATDGIPSARQENLYKGIKPIPQTSPLLANAIDNATKEFGVDKVNVFAHSKGGLVARHAQRDDPVAKKIDNLITFGSPHHGFNLPTTWFTCPKFPTQGNERADCEEAAREFSIDRIREEFNYRGCRLEGPWWAQKWKDCQPRYKQQPTISYRTLVGGEGDVGAKNATYPWRADQAPFPSRSNVDAEFDFRFGVTPAEHSAIKERKESYQCAISLIDEDIYPSSSCTEQKERDASAGTVNGQAPILPGSEYQILLEKQGSLASNSTQTIEAYVDNGDRVLFNIFSIEALSATLVTPSGQEINPESIGIDTIHYAAQQGTGFGDNVWWYQYQVDSPVRGNWGIRIQTTSATDYQAVYLIDSALEFSSRTDLYTYQPSDIVTLEAVFLDFSGPLSGTIIQGAVTQPGGAEDTLVFYDDGTNGDVESGDGIYTTQFTAGGTAIQRSGSPIHGHAVINLVGSKDGASRLLSTSIAVSSPTADFLQVVNENPIDNDSDGFYDVLQIDLLVNVTMSGQYEVSADLKDANGNPIVTAFYSTLSNGTGALPEGQNVIPLRFDGKQIRQHNMDGPYTLTNLAIDFDGMFQVDTAHDVYTTSAYSANQFQGAALSIMSGNDQAVDENANSLFDRLMISLNLNVVKPGQYEWNGRLVDIRGAEIGWAVGSGYLDNTSPMTFDFDGQRIGANGVDGPYILRDVSIYQTSGGNVTALFEKAYTTGNYNASQFEGGMPDLIVQQITATKSGIEVVIKNQGAGPVLPEHDFWVDVYINPKSPPTKANETWKFLGDWGLVWGVVAPAVPLQPGDTVTLSINDPYFWPTYSNFPATLPPGTAIYAQVDSANTTTTYGGVLENHEAAGGVYNNIFGPVYSVDVSGNKIHLPIITRGGLPSAAGVEQTPVQLELSVNPLPSRP